MEDLKRSNTTKMSNNGYVNVNGISNVNRSRLLIAITGAWSVRNILLSGLADRLSNELEIVIALPEGYSSLGDALGSFKAVRFSAEKVADSECARLQRRLAKAHLEMVSPKMARYLNQVRTYRRPMKRRVVSAGTQWMARVDSQPARFQRLVNDEYAQWEKQADSKMGELISSWNATAILFPEPHMPEERSLARWAKKMGLKTVAMVRSFDNLTTKGRHPIMFDHYLVWNQQMRDELLHAYSEVPANNVHVAGTPQFQFYFSPEYTGSREELAQLYDLDPKRPLILYAGNATGTVPHEILVVTQLCDALRRMPVEQRPQLIVRPHPVERNSKRWDEVKQ
jgi:hypothetical protein